MGTSGMMAGFVASAALMFFLMAVGFAFFTEPVASWRAFLVGMVAMPVVVGVFFGMIAGCVLLARWLG